MPIPKGFIFHLNEAERAEKVQRKINRDNGTFSEALSISELEPTKRYIALISFSGERLDYIGILRRGNFVVTGKYRVEFYELLSLDSLPISSFQKDLEQSLREKIILSSSGSGGQIPIQAWDACLAQLKSLRPYLAQKIDHIINLAQLSGQEYKGRAKEILLLQRDAIGAALDIFSGANILRKEVLNSWAPSQKGISQIEITQPESHTLDDKNFLLNISHRHQNEEKAVQHDLFNWPSSITSHFNGISTFSQGDRNLSLVYANRNPLEKTLGVDLIYYNARYGLFAMVQYKLMKEKKTTKHKGDTDDDKPEFSYRPDQQFTKQLMQMNDFANRFRKDESLQSPEEYRLNNDGFFFKMVVNKPFKIGSDQLSEGMYIPREYMNFLMESGSIIGPKGGKYFTLENVGRYLSNSDFVAAINKGWLGTSGTSTAKIQEIIEYYLETGKGLIIAQEN